MNRFEHRAMERKNEQGNQSQLPINMPQAQTIQEEPELNRFEQRAIERKSKPEEEESWLKSAARTALQIPQGIASAVTYPLDIINAMGYYEAVSPESVDDLKRASQLFGIPFDEQEYLDSAGRHAQRFPTVSNIARETEELTGAPLQAKTGLQKFVNFASTAGKLAPKDYTFRGMNTSLPRPILGTGVAATAEAAKELGVPEPIADIGAFAILKKPTEGAGKLSVGKERKPSGLPVRRYENIRTEKKVPPETVVKIERKTENDFREIANDILDKSPIGETRKELGKSYEYKYETQEAFKKVEELASEIPGKISTDSIKRKIIDNVLNKKSTGYTPSEHEKHFKNEIYRIIQETKTKDVTAQALVGQFRKNNRELTQIFEPGKSFAENAAKREALLEHNRAIADIIQEHYPNSEFSKLFKESNKKWSEIMDAEYIDQFLDDLFKGKINYEKGKDFFNKAGMSKKFEKAMGAEGFSRFKTLMNDLMSTEQARKLLKEAEALGFQDFAKTVGSYLIHPNLAKAKLGMGAITGGVRKIYHILLDKPRIAVKWDKAINAAKAGDFKTAETLLNEVREAEVIFDNKPKPKAAEKPTVTINAKAEKVESPSKPKEQPKQLESKPEVKSEVKSEKQESKQIEFKKEKKVTTLKTTKKSPSNKESSEPIQLGYNKAEKNLDFEIAKEKINLEKLKEEQGKVATKEKTEVIKKINELELEKYNLKIKKPEVKENKESKPKQKRMTKEDYDHLFGLTRKKADPAKKVNVKIENAADKPNITKSGLTIQKNYLLDQVDEALKILENPNPGVERAVLDGKRLNIKVPGDGEFNLIMDKDSLNKFKEKVEKKWPEEPVKNEKHLTNPKQKQPKELKEKSYYLKKGADITKKIKALEEAKKSRNLMKTEEKELADLKDLLENFIILYENASK